MTCRDFDEVLLEIIAEIDATIQAYDQDTEARRAAIMDFMTTPHRWPDDEGDP
jgi:hypothetical protein